MYFSIAFVLFALLLVFVLATGRRRWAIKKVYSMCCREKCELLNDLIAPFGYLYIECQDIISSRNDAWQRDMGYTSLFDRMAAHFHMVFDALPVYFNYRGRTWLIEFWKGQYGINTGAEIGIYYADRILSEEELSTFLFQAVEDKDMLPLSFELTRYRSDDCLASVSKKTWWLTAFCMGRFSQPHQNLREQGLCPVLRRRAAELWIFYPPFAQSLPIFQQDFLPALSADHPPLYPDLRPPSLSVLPSALCFPQDAYSAQISQVCGMQARKQKPDLIKQPFKEKSHEHSFPYLPCL